MPNSSHLEKAVNIKKQNPSHSPEADFASTPSICSNKRPEAVCTEILVVPVELHSGSATPAAPKVGFWSGWLDFRAL